jgi:hypothetical protein
MPSGAVKIRDVVRSVVKGEYNETVEDWDKESYFRRYLKFLVRKHFRPRYCKQCGNKLSVYNAENKCFIHPDYKAVSREMHSMGCYLSEANKRKNR